ncbi:MAG TPA: hypothetical protein VGD56_03080 [Gemmatirosa sp.]
MNASENVAANATTAREPGPARTLATATARAAALLAAASLLAFVLGLAVGRATATPGVTGRPAPPIAMTPDVVVAALTRELALDPAQQARVRDAFRRHQGAVDDAWRAVAPHVRAAIDSTQMDILDALRPDQRARFREYLRTSHPGMPVASSERRPDDR